MRVTEPVRKRQERKKCIKKQNGKEREKHHAGLQQDTQGVEGEVSGSPLVGPARGSRLLRADFSFMFSEPVFPQDDSFT